jgi:hypothetical protein
MIERTIYNDPELDRLDRIRAMRDMAKETWPMLLFPIVGWIGYPLLLLEARYGKRL